MKQQRTLASVDWVCEFFGKTRQAFYQLRHRKDKRCVDEELVIHYANEFRKDMPRLGTRKLHYMLQPQLKASGIKCGRDKLFSVLRRSGLLIKRRRARRCFTRSIPISRHFPNLVKDITIDAPEQVWVSDTTGVAIRDGLAYVTMTTDVYSKQVMGYHMQRTKESTGSLATLRMALSRRWYPERQLIHHSDGGSEYFNHAYLNELCGSHVRASCTAPSSPQENPVAERINGILKQEFLLTEDRRSFDEVLEKLPEAIRIYNEHRPHASIDYMTPREAHGCSGPIRRRWKAYRKANIREASMTHIGQQIQLIMSSWPIGVNVRSKERK